MTRPNRYPYTKSQWEKEETTIYTGENKPYMKLTREINKITSEIK